jgi:hypothetical protein
MSRIARRLHKAVVERANSRCEYCQLSQVGQEATFHVDHIQPIADGGLTQEENLAWACVSCSLKKGSRQVLMDSVTAELTRLFHPRLDVWRDHFRWDGEYLVALTATGRVTIDALALNRESIVWIRQELMLRGEHPAKD